MSNEPFDRSFRFPDGEQRGSPTRPNMVPPAVTNPFDVTDINLHTGSPARPNAVPPPIPLPPPEDKKK